MTGKLVTKPSFVPTAEEIHLATTMAVAGISQEQIALCIRGGIDPKTLRKHFDKPMRIARAKAHSNMGKNIYQRAMDGDAGLSRFYAQTQMGWKVTEVTEGAVSVTFNTTYQPKPKSKPK